ncbi:PP2C family protein-serine/threonine phosphatase [Streptomyces sp. NPDC059740]|uniref:PP2C family protein-serine/threonine phosphatase n=1 Tax=Streptomyces sp. NPDC059740 TaxID=3346926 RepID=UPI00365218EA
MGNRLPFAGRLVLLPVLLVVCIVLVDLLAPDTVHLGPLLVAAPAVTSSFAGPRLTAVVGALAVGAQVLLAALRDGVGTSNHLAQIAALVAVSAVLVLYCRLRERRNAELSQVRSVSDAVQQVLLRPPPPGLGPLRLASAYRAAVDESRVGGDFYGAVRFGRTTRLLIGDVRGKGMEALDDSALMLGAFRSAAHAGLDLLGLAAHLDGALRRNAVMKAAAEPGEGAQGMPEAAENFATALLIDVSDEGRRLTLLSCGHPPPLLLRSGTVTSLQAARPSPPLGLGVLQPEAGSPQEHLFAEGDTLLLYTDGVIEAREPAGDFYPLADRLGAWRTRQSGAPSPDTLVDWVLRDLAAFTGGRLEDDAALFAVHRAVPPGR